MKKYSIDELSQMIDHTNLKAFADEAAMKKLCEEAKHYHFRMVAINQVQSEICAKFLKETDVHVGAAISFPLGQTSIESKAFEVKDAIAKGATEIDYVIHIGKVKDQQWAYLKKEMETIVEICRKEKVISKVIFENAYLEKEEIICMATIAKEVRPDFIKTSTGMAPTGATKEDVSLMKEIVGAKVKVKAAGGIRDVETFKEMVRCGAKRIGTSSGISIIEAFKEELQKSGKESIEI